MKTFHPKPYPYYKPSDVEWLGDIPTHWKVARLKGQVANVTDQTSERGPDEIYIALEHVESWTGKFSDAGDDVSFDSQVKRFQVGDVLFGKLRPYLAKVTSPRRNGICVGEFLVLRCLSYNLVPGYLEYLLRSKPIIDAIDASTFGAKMPRADWNFIGSMRQPLPPLAEQTAVVRYLDQADERIRRYVSSRERLIELLEEYRQGVIHHAVTSGLDLDVRLKSSGVEWLGDVPGHWEVRRVKQVSRILRGKFTHRPRNDPSLYNGPYPFIQTGDVARAKKTITGYSQTLNKQGLAVSMMFPTGTLVMTIAANIGDVAILDFEACFPDSVVGFVPHQNVDRDYLYYLFRAMKAEFLRETPVNTQGNLNVERIGSRHIALPLISEQAAIIAYLDKATADIDADIDRARQEIELLGEYRTRLIADVVTGQVDVREAAAELSLPLFNGQK